MFAVRLALTLLALFAACCMGLGIAAGLTADVASGVSGRPVIYWVMAAAYLVLGSLFWPQLASWYMPLTLPEWHRSTQAAGRRGLEQQRDGRPVLQMAAEMERGRRLHLAIAILAYGGLWALLSIPIPVALAVAAVGGRGLTLVEAIPSVIAVGLPAVVTGRIITRSRAA